MLSARLAEAGRVCPGEGCTVVRPQDEVYVVDSRALCCRTNEAYFAEGIRVTRYELVGENGARAWRSVALEEFLASSNPAVPTIVFAHGNRVERNEVTKRGLWVYGRVLRCDRDARPVRFVIFSWPSDQIKGLIKDAREKAARTKPAGYHLAWVLNQMPADTPLGLFGYSFGARVVSGATHLLAGGSLGRLKLPAEGELPKRPIHAVYLAAAFDANWLGPRQYHGRAMEQIDSLLIATNRQDPAMKFYKIFNERRRPALGYEGPTCLSREAASRVWTNNLTSAVGKTHDMCEYMTAGRRFMASACRRLTFADEALPVAVREEIQTRGLE